jgi:hypothetical protein
MFNPQTFLQRRAEDGRNPGRKTQGYHQTPLVDSDEILFEASAYLYGFHQEHGMLKAFSERLNKVQVEIKQKGIYWQTYEELAYGARVAWRFMRVAQDLMEITAKSPILSRRNHLLKHL